MRSTPSGISTTARLVAELRETKMEVVAFREGRGDDGGGGGEEEGIEDEGGVVPATSVPVERQGRSSGKKRKAAAQVEELLRNVKVKRTSPTTRKPRPTDWTTDEEAALLEGVDEHSFDFDRIKAKAGARLGDRTAKAFANHFRDRHPESFRELREATPNKPRPGEWTAEEDNALKRGRLNHGDNWEIIPRDREGSSWSSNGGCA